MIITHLHQRYIDLHQSLFLDSIAWTGTKKNAPKFSVLLPIIILLFPVYVLSFKKVYQHLAGKKMFKIGTLPLLIAHIKHECASKPDVSHEVMFTGVNFTNEETKVTRKRKIYKFKS